MVYRIPSRFFNTNGYHKLRQNLIDETGLYRLPGSTEQITSLWKVP